MDNFFCFVSFFVFFLMSFSLLNFQYQILISIAFDLYDYIHLTSYHRLYNDINVGNLKCWQLGRTHRSSGNRDGLPLDPRVTSANAASWPPASTASPCQPAPPGCSNSLFRASFQYAFSAFECDNFSNHMMLAMISSWFSETSEKENGRGRGKRSKQSFIFQDKTQQTTVLFHPVSLIPGFGKSRVTNVRWTGHVRREM